jgi:hypothetical protein
MRREFSRRIFYVPSVNIGSVLAVTSVVNPLRIAVIRIDALDFNALESARFWPLRDAGPILVCN